MQVRLGLFTTLVDKYVIESWWTNAVVELVEKYLIKSWWTNTVVELVDKYLIESRRQLCGLSPTMRAITPLVRIN